ncbi:SDR family oxidoreductase [Amycolatopsis sp. RTGN1]|uniref:SDR family oxidoreductase n=1 Tax=Amycolatopsis ponsaeliensis TaxID=2992142 RepID=UPI00254D267C|nr:NAD(P)H-binding protein [Amycolatopsis sp. RTGN1]
MITVMGATGNVGRPLVEALTAAGEEVRAVSRKGPFPGDVSDAASLRPAFEGATAVFLLLPPGFHGPVSPILASADGARVVLLSSQGVGTGRHPSFFEDEVRGSSLPWTILRPSGFASNALQWAESVRTSRVLSAPFGDVGLPVIDPADIAEVAAATLLSPLHTGRTYELTGPALVSPRDQAAAIGTALGEPVRFTPQTRPEALASFQNFMPPEVAEATLDILGSPTRAEQRVSPDVAQILGRPARPFADWAARNAVAFK